MRPQVDATHMMVHQDGVHGASHFAVVVGEDGARGVAM